MKEIIMVNYDKPWRVVGWYIRKWFCLSLMLYISFDVNIFMVLMIHLWFICGSQYLNGHLRKLCVSASYCILMWAFSLFPIVTNPLLHFLSDTTNVKVYANMTETMGIIFANQTDVAVRYPTHMCVSQVNVSYCNHKVNGYFNVTINNPANPGNLSLLNMKTVKPFKIKCSDHHLGTTEFPIFVTALMTPCRAQMEWIILLVMLWETWVFFKAPTHNNVTVDDKLLVSLMPLCIVCTFVHFSAF
jgi:hypothetical protein